MDRPDLAQLRFQDLRVGDVYEVGELTLGREEMMAFASQYDPQPFHLDDEAARANPLFKELSASGWHSVLRMLMLLSDFWSRTQVQGLAGAGVQEIQWQTPVYAGERLRISFEIESLRVSASKPDRAIMRLRGRATKADGQVATVICITGMFANN
jgi:acyl dehydratase